MTLLHVLVLVLALYGAGDEGVGIDPNGRPRRATTLEGNGLDPHGTPKPTKSSGATTNGDDGSGLDPHGGRRP